ncbi:hypothetical protein K490DRAFT_49021 [Saccharata proteae CBS 121410]|uniref:Aspergillopepsin n=1 Tax=Saccharata proteae CBS 121410 TaxID=1314787 RepID=A0A9P4HPW7_9PEZI|nr:hypothetical protein K490DRAFT_49021 [Saccharata proteae CBS 121410]
MKFSAALLSTALLASAAVAAPSGKGHGLADRIARRKGTATTGRKSNPVMKVDAPAAAADANKSNIEYSSNWAGAVYEEPPSGTFTAVVGTFTVPVPSSDGDSFGESAASAWVGIDGDTYGNAILQTGIDFVVDGGEVSYDAWYEWYPDYAYDFSGIDISAGDVISLKVESSSSSRGTCIIENETTGTVVSKSLTAPESDATLGGQNAEWIVEDFEENGSLVNFADFGTVVFTGATAGLSTGKTITAGDASIIEIESDGQVLTDVSISGSTVTVVYA